MPRLMVRHWRGWLRSLSGDDCDPKRGAGLAGARPHRYAHGLPTLRHVGRGSQIPGISAIYQLRLTARTLKSRRSHLLCSSPPNLLRYSKEIAAEHCADVFLRIATLREADSY